MAAVFVVPAYLSPLLSLFAAHGAYAYPVGGCVRDTLMGREPHDWDVAVTTPPEETVAICRAAGYRTVPTGMKHGTVTVLMPHSGDPHDRTGAYEPVECTTCRTEGGYSDGRHPDCVAFTDRIEDDLSRRDFTVNAMAFVRDEATGGMSVLDPFGGRDDLQARFIRCVGEPDTRFSEDALRILRAVRFAVRLGFTIHADTMAAIRRGADGLARISRERIGDEFGKILCSPAPDRGILWLDELGLMPHILPYGYARGGVGQLSTIQSRRMCAGADANAAAHVTANATANATEAMADTKHPTVEPSLPALRIACLQWGLATSDVERNLTALRLPNAVRRDVLAVCAARELPVRPTPYMARVWRSTLGALAESALLVRRAHSELQGTEAADTDALRSLVAASEAAHEPVRTVDLAINGRDLLALGYQPGRGLQVTLQALLEVVWEDPRKNTREALIEEAIRRKE